MRALANEQTIGIFKRKKKYASAPFDWLKPANMTLHPVGRQLKSVASNISCTPETLRPWIRKIEVDAGGNPSVTSDQAPQMKTLERENRELKRANEILRKAAVFSPR